jgi:hypothetical protein
MNHLTEMILPSFLSQVCDDAHASKAPGLRWVKSALRGRCGACPMQRHRAAHRAYPENRFAPIKLIHIYPEPLYVTAFFRPAAPPEISAAAWR